MLTLRDETPTARKEHQCQFCFRTIFPGEKYRLTVHLDGECWTFKACAHCDAMTTLCGLFDMDFDGNGIDRNTFSEMEPSDSVEEALQEAWRARWRNEDGSLHPIPAESLWKTHV